MNKWKLVVVLCACPFIIGAAPSRTYNYVTGQVIDPSHVQTNEDNIFSYIQAGVDTYVAGSVNAAAIGDDAVGAPEIVAGAVGASEIAAGAVDAGDMATTGTITDDKVFVADSSTTGTWRSIPNATGTSFLQYTASTNSFSAAVAGSDVGGTNAVRVVRTAGNVTINTGTLTDFTGATATITTGANPVQACWQASLFSANATENVYYNVDVDGTKYTGTSGHSCGIAVASENQDCSFCIQTDALTAASHTIKLMWRNDAVADVTTTCTTATSCMFSVMEVVD